MQFGLSYKIDIDNRAFRKIERKLARNTYRAIKHYAQTVKSALLPMRSEHVRGNLRRRVPPYSKPGQYPHSQTLELQRSIKWESEETSPGVIHAVAYTDVKYAMPLEVGGLTEFEPNRKHSRFWLVNFIKRPVFIAARPMWLPILIRELPRIFIIITRI